MEFNAAAVMMLCLGFAVGYLVVLSFLERPILPMMASPDATAENEDDLRDMHAMFRSFLRYVGNNILFPISMIATTMAALQAVIRDFDPLSMFVLIGLVMMVCVSLFRIRPLAVRLRELNSFEHDLDDVAGSLFRLVRVHNVLMIGAIPVTLAQFLLLFT